jgi:hypothetical protein
MWGQAFLSLHLPSWFKLWGSLTFLMITLMKQGQCVFTEIHANRAMQVQLEDGGSKFF